MLYLHGNDMNVFSNYILKMGSGTAKAAACNCMHVGGLQPSNSRAAKNPAQHTATIRPHCMCSKLKPGCWLWFHITLHRFYRECAESWMQRCSCIRSAISGVALINFKPLHQGGLAVVLARCCCCMERVRQKGKQRAQFTSLLRSTNIAEGAQKQPNNTLMKQ